MAISKGYKTLLDEAMQQVKTITLEEARELYELSEACFIDIRDIRELERDGMIPEAVHAPRGMLEFWVDPDSPYYREVFGQSGPLILYCQSAWRSALATLTLQQMGLDNVCHLEGGFKNWMGAGLPVAEKRAVSH